MRAWAGRAGAGLVFVVTLNVYATMLSANVGNGDEAEAQTVPYILGIAHPTGFPAYTLAGWVFAHVVPLGTVAWRLNLFTAVCTALTASGVFLLAVTCAADFAVALLAALVFAFGGTAWATALHANAQSLSSTCSVFSLLGSVIFARSGDVRAFIFACACAGLGIATHPASIWVLPAIPVALAWQYKRITLRTLLAGTGALAGPLLLYAYLPLRSAYIAAHGLDPNAGAPLFGAGNFDWDANSPRTMAGFLNEVLGRHEGSPGAFHYMFTRLSVVNAARWWSNFAALQYDRWLLVLAALATIVLALRDRRTFTVLAAGTLGGAAFTFIYRFDSHIDRYTIVTFAVTAAVAAAISNVGLPRRPALALRSLVIAGLAVLAGLAVVHNRAAIIAAPGANGQIVIEAARQQTPDGAIIVAQWPDAAALGYGAFVERVLGSRLIVTAWPAQYAGQYEMWAATRPVLEERSFGPSGSSFFPVPMLRQP